jgi:hypothetical protein
VVIKQFLGAAINDKNGFQKQEEVPWKENFSVIPGNEHLFLGFLGNVFPKGLSPLYSRKSALFLGSVNPNT